MKSKSILNCLGSCILLGMFALNMNACETKLESSEKLIVKSNGDVEIIKIPKDKTKDYKPSAIYFSTGYTASFEDDKFKSGSLSFHIRVEDYGKNPGIKSIEIYEDGEILKRIANAEVKEATIESDGARVAYENEEEQFSGSDYYEDNLFSRSVWVDVTDKTGEHEYFVKVIDKGGHEIKTEKTKINHDEFKIPNDF